MLLLTQPIWLIAMAGIAIPVILHLWNNKRGRVLAIGSISFLEKISPRQSRTRRLSEWLLLLLRCGLLLAAALLLAGPFWRQSPQGKGWVLVAAEGDSAKGQYAVLIDSLVKAGYEKHVWKDAPGVAGERGVAGRTDVEEEAGVAESTGVAGESGRGDRSYWALFAEADRKAPARMPFYVITDGRINHFFGSRPFTERTVNWYTYGPSSPGDSVSHWIRSAWLSSPDSICVLTGSSRPTGTGWQSRTIPAREGRSGEAGGGNGFHIGLSGGRLSVALDSQPPVNVDTGTVKIHIYADKKYSNDSRYLVAAIRALQQFTKRKMQVSVGNEAGRARRPDWVFWLSSRPVAAEVTAANLLLYESGREMPVDSWISGREGEAIAGQISREVVPSIPSIGKEDRVAGSPAIWQDGFGRPVLVAETVRRAVPGIDSIMRVFHFFSHFDPSWNGLVWSPSFPALLEGLLSGGGMEEDDQHDLRVLDPGQVTPLKRAGEPGAPAKGVVGAADGLASGGSAPGGSVVSGSASGRSVMDGSAADLIDLAPACWTILLLLFIAERLVSFMDPKTKVYG